MGIITHPKKIFDAPTEKLLDVLSETLYYIAEMEMTTEQANAIKDRLNRPLGILGSKHKIPSNRVLKRQAFRRKSLDSSSGQN